MVFNKSMLLLKTSYGVNRCVKYLPSCIVYVMWSVWDEHTQSSILSVSFLHSFSPSLFLSPYGETGLILFTEASLFLSSSHYPLFSSTFSLSSPNPFLQISISPADIYKPLGPTLAIPLSTSLLFILSLPRSLSLSLFPTGLCYLIFLKRSRCHSPLKPERQRPKSSPLSMGHAPQLPVCTLKKNGMGGNAEVPQKLPWSPVSALVALFFCLMCWGLCESHVHLY